MDKSIARVVESLRDLTQLPQMGRLFLTLMTDRRVPLWLKISAASGVLYVISPIDVIPDKVTGIGYLDDVIVSILIIQTFIDMAPQGVVLEHCHRLGIAPQDVQINITQAVTTSIGAVLPFLEGRSGESTGQSRQSPAGNYSAGREQAEPTAEQPPERQSRYSAYNAAPATE